MSGGTPYSSSGLGGSSVTFLIRGPLILEGDLANLELSGYLVGVGGAEVVPVFLGLMVI
jgi:hypothetical protein